MKAFITPHAGHLIIVESVVFVRVTVLFSLLLLFNCAPAQPEDPIFLSRYLKGQDKEYVNIPLTSFYLLNEAHIRDNFGWLLEDDYSYKKGNLTLIIEMNSTDVPPGPWTEYAPGALQVVFEIPDNGRNPIVIRLDTLKKSLKLINHYAGFENKSSLRGELEIEKGEHFVINGAIDIISSNPYVVQKIIIDNHKTKGFSVDELKSIEREKERIALKREQEYYDLLGKVSAEQKDFYDSVFNLKKYPGNSLKASFNRWKEEFRFELDASYVLPKSMVDRKHSDNLMELLGGNIFQASEGRNYVILLHHFRDPMPNSIDDETNFSVLFELPSLDKGTIDLSKEGTFAKLGYWHYGPGGGVIQSTGYSGWIIINESKDNIVSGVIDVKFRTSGKNDFLLKGDFQLPIATWESFRSLQSRIDAIIRQYNK